MEQEQVDREGSRLKMINEGVFTGARDVKRCRSLRPGKSHCSLEILIVNFSGGRGISLLACQLHKAISFVH